MTNGARELTLNWQRLRASDRTTVRPDLFAGLGVAAYLVPQVMAYATLAGLPPVVGLWASLLPLIVYAFAGTSRLLSIGPESTAAIMTAAALAPLAAGDPATYAGLAAVCAVIVGTLCLVAGALRVGFVTELLSRPVLIGYLAGVAVIMIAGQLGKLLSVPVTGGTPIVELWSGLSQLGSANAVTATLGISVVVLLFVGTAYAPTLPWPLIAVLLATVATAVGDLEQYGVTVVGAIPQGLPGISIPQTLDEVAPLLGPAAAIAIVAFTDNVLTARAFAEPGERIDADVELATLGAANVAAGLTSGMPVSSSGSRTALARTAQARTPAYGLVTAAVIVCVLLFAGPLLSRFPMAALGGLVIFAACKIVRLDEFRWLWHFRRTEFWLAVAALVAVLTLNLLAGIGVAVVLSLVAMMARVARPHAAVLGQVPGLAGMHDIGDYPDAVEVDGLVVFRYDSPLFFANAEDFRVRALAAVTTAAEHREVTALLLNCEANIDADSTAVAAMSDLIHEVQGRGIIVALARVHTELAELLGRAGLLDLIGSDHVFPTLPTAVAALRTDTPEEP